MNGYTVMLDISLGRQLSWDFMECLAVEDLKPSNYFLILFCVYYPLSVWLRFKVTLNPAEGWLIDVNFL